MINERPIHNELRTEGWDNYSVIVVSFDDDRNAYKVLTLLKGLDSQHHAGVQEAVVVERFDDGRSPPTSPQHPPVTGVRLAASGHLGGNTIRGRDAAASRSRTLYAGEVRELEAAHRAIPEHRRRDRNLAAQRARSSGRCQAPDSTPGKASHKTARPPP